MSLNDGTPSTVDPLTSAMICVDYVTAQDGEQPKRLEPCKQVKVQVLWIFSPQTRIHSAGSQQQAAQRPSPTQDKNALNALHI